MKETKLADIDIYKIGTEIQIAGALWSGSGKNFICLFPYEDINNNEFVLLRMDLEGWEKFLKQSDTQEVKILKRSPKGTTKAILRKSQRQIDTHVMWIVFRRDNFTCRYCGRRDVPLTVDHLVLWEDGGPSIKENLVASCKNCNKARGSIPYEEWLESDYYKKVSRGLSPHVNIFNEAKVSELSTISKMKNIRSR